jgi:hypothetical protein
LSNTSPFNGEAALWWTSADGAGSSGRAQVSSPAQLTASAITLSTELGTNYRHYGEALTTGTTNTTDATTTVSSDGTSTSVTTSLTAGQSQAATTDASLSNTGSVNSSSNNNVGNIQSVYEGSNKNLSSVQKSIEPAMQSLDNDWNVVKTTIAAKRPGLLDQKWDFVTDNGTVQAVSNTLTTEQKSWLTGMLNQNQNLVSDTQSINSQLVTFYQKSLHDDGTGADGKSNISLPQLTAQNIDGVIPFLALMAGADPASLIRQGLENKLAAS